MKLWLVNGILRKDTPGKTDLMAIGYHWKAESEDAAIGGVTKALQESEPDYAIASIFAGDITEVARGFVGREWLEGLLPQILHGDEKHRAWLTEAFHAWQSGMPVPPPIGKGVDEEPTHMCIKCGWNGVVKSGASFAMHLRPGTEDPCDYIGTRIQR